MSGSLLHEGRNFVLRKIYITDSDKRKLQKLIDDHVYDDVNKEYVEELEAELKRAETVNARKIPGNVITMNSKVLLLADGIEEEVSLVYPDEADVIKNKISVLSPIGTAILGYAEGDMLEWDVPSGKVRVEVKKVLYQPEADKKFDA
jgi:regulator of nucleoside diphosphate kinase